MPKSQRLTPEALEDVSAKAEAKQATVDAEVAAEEAAEEKAVVAEQPKKIAKKQKKVSDSQELTSEDIEWMFNDGLVEIGLLLPARGKEMFKKLCKQQRVMTVVPYDLKETRTRNNPKEVIKNGLKFVIPKNTQVLLPESIAKEVMRSQDTQGTEDIKNSHGESLNVNASEEAKKWFGIS